MHIRAVPNKFRLYPY